MNGTKLIGEENWYLCVLHTKQHNATTVLFIVCVKHLARVENWPSARHKSRQKMVGNNRTNKGKQTH